MPALFLCSRRKNAAGSIMSGIVRLPEIDGLIKKCGCGCPDLLRKSSRSMYYFDSCPKLFMQAQLTLPAGNSICLNEE